MLVLNRRWGEEVVIRDEAGNELARIVVVHTTKSRVKLGIVAPDTTSVLRGELAPQRDRSRS